MNEMIKRIAPVTRVKADIRLPGSKSITHRALLIAALGGGVSRIDNPLQADDTFLTAQALEKLGAGIRWDDDGTVTVTPPAARWKSPESPIMLGNSGTSMRLLPGVASAGEGRFVFDGTGRLRERPIGPLLDALAQLGVRFKYLGKEGFPPFEIESGGLDGGDVFIDASSSSQFLSSILLAAPLARSNVRVQWGKEIASFPYVGITLEMMRRAGIQFEWLGGDRVEITAPGSYQSGQYPVEGDCSSASYFWAAAAITGGEVFTVPVAPCPLQGDCGFLGVLEKMGCRVERGDGGARVFGPERLMAVDLDMNEMPDMVPTLAVAAAFAEGVTRIRNVAHLRIKESDRLSAVASELLKLGTKVREYPDGLEIEGGPIRGCALQTYDDHRIAMAFALTGLRTPGVEIHGAETVAKSFPNFWEKFKLLSHDTV